MFIKSTIRELLSDDELVLLDVHGDLLRGLASGEIEPSTKNQERFVREISGNYETAVGISSKAWKKYTKLEDILNKVSDLEQAVEFKNKENEVLRKELSSIEKFAEILQLDLSHSAPFEWNEEALAKLSEDNKLALKRFERALVLKEVGIVSKEIFEEFSVASGLWKALHNYEKVLHPQSHSTYSSDRPRVHMNICGSCGGAIVNGYCKCSG